MFMCVVYKSRNELQKIIQLKPTIPSFHSLPFDIATIDLHNLVKDDDKFKNFNNELLKLRFDTITITFCEWIKQKHDKCSVPVSTRIPFTTTLTTFIDKFIQELVMLKQHVNHFYIQSKAFKTAKETSLTILVVQLFR
ncbi:unnamed protein product [Didymodactylos carnosus]|uniref:Uncharacterized protein n=1 Tax=Didymodactylos carnosus TaxID=1234261 RepID=A0A8S2X857_9BILA|nr:unnamed protein product [Didymodactylos carnosus]